MPELRRSRRNAAANHEKLEKPPPTDSQSLEHHPDSANSRRDSYSSRSATWSFGTSSSRQSGRVGSDTSSSAGSQPLQERHEQQRVGSPAQTRRTHPPLVFPTPSSKQTQTQKKTAKQLGDDKEARRYGKPWMPPSPGGGWKQQKSTGRHPALGNIAEEKTWEQEPDTPALMTRVELGSFEGLSSPPKSLENQRKAQGFINKRQTHAPTQREHVAREKARATATQRVNKLPPPRRANTSTANRHKEAKIDQPETEVAQSQNTPDFDINSQASAMSDSDNSGLHGTIEDPNAPGWLRHWLQEKGYAKPEDLHLHPYKGFQIEGPKLQLIRAKNFLSAHDAENCDGWSQKFDELCRYVEHLSESYEDEDWDYDMIEVLEMLKTHRIWEKYMYGKPKLDLWLQDGNGEIMPYAQRFTFDRNSVVTFYKGYRPPGAPCHRDERGSLAGKSPGLFIQPHAVENPPEHEKIDPFAYTKGASWFNKKEREWAERIRENVLKEAQKQEDSLVSKSTLISLPPAANWNGPIVNTLLDDGMKETYDKIKKYAELAAKLRRTVWKTAVYGKRVALEQCLKGLDRGLSGKTWSGLPVSAKGTEAQENLPMRPAEFAWLEFLTDVAPVRARPVDMEPMAVAFLDRLQKLLADRREDGVFAKHANEGRETPLSELTDAINLGLKKNDVQQAPKKIYIFDQNEVWTYAGIGMELGMVRCKEQRDRRGRVVSRSIGELTALGLLPEHRIRWHDVGIDEETALPSGNIEKGATTAHEVTSDSATLASTMPTSLSFKYFGADHDNDYLNYLPKYSSLRPWLYEKNEEHWAPEDKNKTIKFYQHLGARLGLDLYNLREELDETGKAVVESHSTVPGQEGDSLGQRNAASLRDSLKSWTAGYREPVGDEENSPTNKKRQMPLYKDIVEAADHQYRIAGWQDKDCSDDAEEHEAREKVRQGLILEAHGNKSTIWSITSGRSSPFEPGSKFPLWRREPLWDFGNPKIRGCTVRKFFSLNRWPLHLQNEETQEKIKASGPPKVEVAEQVEEVEEVALGYAPARFPGEGDDRVIWRRGTEYWLGGTPKQQAEIWRRTHPSGSKPTPTWKDKIASLFTRKRKRGSQDDIDELEAGSLRLSSPKHMPKVISHREATERRAKKARLTG